MTDPSFLLLGLFLVLCVITSVVVILSLKEKPATPASMHSVLYGYESLEANIGNQMRGGGLAEIIRLSEPHHLGRRETNKNA